MADHVSPAVVKVFVGGSRAVVRLPAPVLERLDPIIGKALPVVIGDAHGADKAVQEYFSARGYRNVEIFCAGSAARNNIGGWRLRIIETRSLRGTVDFYTAKDRAMTDEATVGLMVWDGKSAGTLLNVLRLLGQQKNVVVYAVPDVQFHEFKNLSQWDAFISGRPLEIRRKVALRAATL